MKKLILSFIAILMATGLAAGAPRAESDAPKPTLISFFSETCANCDVLEPKLDTALTAIGKEKVEYIVFDYTTRETINASIALAKSKGLHDLQKQYGAKTGFAVLLKSDGTVADTFTSAYTEGEIEQAISAALTSAI